MSLKDELGNWEGRAHILADLNEERNRQDEKFGEQHHPDGTQDNVAGELAATWMRDRCNEATADGTLTWRDILLEEVYEALAETDQARLRNELVQSAAVIVNWIEDIDSRNS